MKMKPFGAALLTAFFFGANHFNPYGLIPLVILGLYFGYAAYMSGSILVPVILHFLNNFTAITLYFVYGDDELISSSVQNPAELGSSFLMVLLLSAVFIAVIFSIKKYYSKQIKI